MCRYTIQGVQLKCGWQKSDSYDLLSYSQDPSVQDISSGRLPGSGTPTSNFYNKDTYQHQPGSTFGFGTQYLDQWPTADQSAHSHILTELSKIKVVIIQSLSTDVELMKATVRSIASSERNMKRNKLEVRSTAS